MKAAGALDQMVCSINTNYYEFIWSDVSSVSLRDTWKIQLLVSSISYSNPGKVEPELRHSVQWDEVSVIQKFNPSN